MEPRWRMRRRTWQKLGSGVVLVLFMVAASPTNGVSRARANPATFEAFAEAAAAEFDVPLDQTRKRLEFEREFLELVNVVAEAVPSYVNSALAEDFASLEGTILLFDASSSEMQLAEEILSPLDGAVDIREATLSITQEEEMTRTARERLQWVVASGRSLTLFWNAFRDRLTAQVNSSDPLTTGERPLIETQLADLAEFIVVTDGPADLNEDCPTAPTKTGGITEGGRRIAECGNNDCTAGFSVRSTVRTAWTGILTAAHCNDFVNDTDDWWYIRYADSVTPYSTVRYNDHVRYDRGDIMFLREWFSSANPAPRVYLYGQTWEDVDGFQWQNPINQTVWAKGARSAELPELGHFWATMVGTIVENRVNTTTNGVQPDADNRYAAVDYGDDQNLANEPWEASPRPGDSGSAVFIPNGSGPATALGIHKGGNPGREIYSKIGYALDDMNLELLP